MVREYYESGSDSRWLGLAGQMDQVTYFKLSFAEKETKISVTCIRNEMDWIAKILNEVNNLNVEIICSKFCIIYCL